jgi:hypothetical protein
MTLDNFYALLSGICFALTGLWWTVVEGRKDWLKNPELRSMAGGVYASFLIPGVMSLVLHSPVARQTAQNAGPWLLRPQPLAGHPALCVGACPGRLP